MQTRSVLIYYRIQVLHPHTILPKANPYSHACMCAHTRAHTHRHTTSFASMDKPYLAVLRKMHFRGKWHHYHINDFQPNTSANVATHTHTQMWYGLHARFSAADFHIVCTLNTKTQPQLHTSPYTHARTHTHTHAHTHTHGSRRFTHQNT